MTTDRSSSGLSFSRVFSSPDVSPFDEISWRTSTATIKDEAGAVIFTQSVEAPATWSDQAVRVVASKYFYGDIAGGDDPANGGRESSVRQLVKRVSNTIAKWGQEDGYFASIADANAFGDDLSWLLLNQHGSFNSPVWFNVGLSAAYGIKGAANGWRWDGEKAIQTTDAYRNPQCSACLPYDALVNTTSGLMPIGDVVLAINRGATLSTYDQDGNPTRITAGVCNGKRYLMKIKMADGGTLRLTSNHVVFVRRVGCEEVVESTVEELKSGDRLILSRNPLIPERSLSARGPLDPTPDLAWVSGVMVGNGYSGRPDSATSEIWELKVNTITERDRAIEVIDGYSVPFSVKDFSWGFLIRGYGLAGKAFWDRLGLWNKTGAKEIPDWVLRGDSCIVGQFLNGLFGTDGTVDQRPNDRVQISLSNTSIDVIAKSQILLRSLGVFAYVAEYIDERPDSTRKVGYTLTISDQKSADTFAERIGVTHEVKEAELEARRGTNERDYRRDEIPIQSVCRHGVEMVYDIQTESSTFWYEGVLVHNCFIVEAGDDMESILERGKTEGMLFKYGSGVGCDNSSIRSTREKLSSGGKPSGPVSFMRIYDAIAGQIKSGGAVRRAAKMETLKDWHPDIIEFANIKAHEDKKARDLVSVGYSGGMNGEASATVGFQNANLSVRCSDAFLMAVESGGDWTTRAVTTGLPVETFPASRLMDAIAEGTWICGDPGVQYEDVIQKWHTCPNTAPIDSSNPCSEYMHINNSACNLACPNLMRFRRPDGTFDVERYRAVCRIFITAQEITVDRASYPTAKIAENAHKFRQLGQGYTGLGGLIMSLGLPYDSDEGRSLAGAVTAIMHGQTNLTSVEMAKEFGPFEGYAVNREPMLGVMEMHRHAASDGLALSIANGESDSIREIWEEASEIWNQVVEQGTIHGFRNSQTTVLMPCGTTAFMLDSGDFTGIEPGMALVSYKTLAGGGMLKIANRIVPMALDALGYAPDIKEDILQAIEATDTIEKSRIHPEDLPVFDCAFPPANGSRSIHWKGHLKMMAAVQPFLSGAISKTCNLPRTATVADIRDAYLEAWKLGLKAVAIYRDGSKESQPVSTSKATTTTARDEPRGLEAIVNNIPALLQSVTETSTPRRSRLPDTRSAVTHKLSVGGVEAYLTVGEFPDGRPGEVFVTMAREGSTLGGLMDGWATAVSIMLQYGIPVDVIVKKFEGGRFEPAGMTRNPGEIPIASSLLDYVARWLGMRYVAGYREAYAPRIEGAEGVELVDIPVEPSSPHPASPIAAPAAHGPLCGVCGSMTIPTGRCFFCPNCLQSIGGCG